MSRTILQVIPNPGSPSWVLFLEDRALGVFSSKSAALNAALSHARQYEPSQVRLYKAGGEVETEFIYGKEPAR